MATNAVAGFGFKVFIGNGDGPPETYSEISEVYEINDFVSPQSLFEDVSHFGTPLTGKDEISVGLDMKTLQFSVNYIPGDDTHNASQGLIKDMIDGTLRSFRVKIPGPDLIGVQLTARVENFAPQTVGRRGALRATVTLRPQTWEEVDASGW